MGKFGVGDVGVGDVVVDRTYPVLLAEAVLEWKALTGPWATALGLPADPRVKGPRLSTPLARFRLVSWEEERRRGGGGGEEEEEEAR